MAPDKIPYDQFTVQGSGETLYLTPEGGNKIPVVATSGGAKFLALGTLARKYGCYGTDAVRASLRLREYDSKTQKVKLSPNGKKAIQEADAKIPPRADNISNEDIVDAAYNTIAGAGEVTATLTDEQQAAALATINDPPMSTEWVGPAVR